METCKVYWDNGKENGNYYSMLGLYREYWKHGNYQSILGYIENDGK